MGTMSMGVTSYSLRIDRIVLSVRSNEADIDRWGCEEATTGRVALGPHKGPNGRNGRAISADVLLKTLMFLASFCQSVPADYNLVSSASVRSNCSRSSCWRSQSLYWRSQSAIIEALVAGHDRSSDSASLSSSSVRSPVLKLDISSAIRDCLKYAASSFSILARSRRMLMFLLQLREASLKLCDLDRSHMGCDQPHHLARFTR